MSSMSDPEIETDQDSTDSPAHLTDMDPREWRTFRAWLLELDRKHSGRQGAIWQELVDTFKLFE